MYEVDLTNPDVIRDPFTAYRRAREAAPVVRLNIPGMPMWALTRHADARAVLTDPRFAITSSSFVGIPGVPEGYDAYLHTMSELDGPDHLRLRRLAAPAFTARRAQDFRPSVEPIAEKLLATLPSEPDLLRDFAKPLPMHVICELVGIPAAERAAWVEWGAIVAAFDAPRLGEAVPGIIESARSAVAARPETGLLADLVRAEDRLTDTELVTLVWHVVLAGQTPANLIANAVAELWTRPDVLAALRADPSLLPGAVDELMRWCGPQLLTVPRSATEDVDLLGTTVKAGEPVTVAIAAVNRDPEAFPDPDRFDITRGAATHLGFGHGPHFCLGAAHARVQTEVALSALLVRDLTLAVDPAELRAPDPGTWRLTALPVRVGE
ncbi:cytochrome P450 [Actinophytocola sp.]|uniref:cytochrome P450 family protein n=1 Tax=Actinophytocola sp. TaxID=1872138 RepID=UPI003899BB32